MPRKPRFGIQGVPQHDIQRGNDREPSFFTDMDYGRYLDTLHAIREALNQELVLGRNDFKDKIETTLKRQARRGQDGRPRINNCIQESEGYYYVW